MAAQAPHATAFLAFQGVAREASVVRRRRSLTIGISLGLHSLLLVAAAAGAFRGQVTPPAPPSPRVVVSLGRPAPPRRAPPPPPEAPKPPPPRKAPPRPVMALVQPQLQTEIAPPTEQAPADEFDDAGVEEQGDDQPVGQAHGLAAITVPAPPPLAPPPRPAITPDQRRQRLAQYLHEALRPRFDSRFIYPPEAERGGVEGRVLLRLTIDSAGRLLSAAAPACPSEILCEHAERTIKEASPFPPPPSDLGSTIQVDMPITYRLD